MQQVIFYSDEENDDFFEGKTFEGTIDEKFKYLPSNPFKKAWDFLLYYFVELPILCFVMFVVQGVRVKNRKAIKKLKNTGYVIVGNHTNAIDTYVGPIGIARPKRTYIISQSNTLKIPYLKHLVKSLGALPIAETMGALKNFDKATSQILKQKKAIIIFPEAHIWPYYTGTRPMRLSSFKLASKNQVPVVPIATTYQKRKFFKKPRMVVYIGEPIMFDKSLSANQNAQIYKQKTEEFIKEKTSQNNFVYRKYIKIENKD